MYNGKWYYSIVDVITILTDSKDPNAYWRKLKQRLSLEGNESVTNCHGLKLISKDKKMRLTDCADRETIFRIIQSVPSPNAEPFKLWFARLAEERIQEINNPELATTSELHKTNESQGDGIASITRKNIEKSIKRPVVTSQNAVDFKDRVSLNK